MAGDIKAKEVASFNLANANGGSATNNSAVAATTADFDARAAGNAGDDFEGMLELTCQWATVTGIVAGTIISEIYFVPKFDGTNAVDIDASAGASFIPGQYYKGAFQASKVPTANTNARFVSPIIKLFPLLYTAYILNRSGQTITANWTLKAITAKGQYT